MKLVKNRIMIDFVAILSLVLLIDMFKSMVRDSTMVFNLSIVRDLWDTVMLYVLLSNTVKNFFQKYICFFFMAHYILLSG